MDGWHLKVRGRVRDRVGSGKEQFAVEKGG